MTNLSSLAHLSSLPYLSREQLAIYLDHLFSSKNIQDFCPNGLQIEGKKEIKKIGTAVSSNLATLEAAAKAKVDALIVHHGLFWQKDTYVIQGVKKQKIAFLLEKQISLFAYHLPMDLHAEIGNNWKAAKDLQISNLEPFGLPPCLIGVKGKMPSLSFSLFKERLEDYYQHSAHYIRAGKEEIETVAIISGGAHRMLTEAIQEKVDAFVTGSFDEPVWHQALEEKINFFAMGHSATERVGPKALAVHLEKIFAIPVEFIDIYNPF